MPKMFICSDIHSFFDEWMLSLKDAGFEEENPEHIIVVLGDLLDRGPKPLECLNFVNSLPKERKILIRGNHEDLMEKMIARKTPFIHDFHNGTIQTARDSVNNWLSDGEAIEKFSNLQCWKQYIQDCVDFYETDKEIFVHGWIPCLYTPDWDGSPTRVQYKKNWRESTSWSKARWFNGMDLWNKGIREPGKTIYCGHWHTNWGHSILHHDGEEWLNDVETCWVDPNTGKTEPHVNFEPFEDEGIIAMDACTAISKKVNCKVLEITD